MGCSDAGTGLVEMDEEMSGPFPFGRSRDLWDGNWKVGFMKMKCV